MASNITDDEMERQLLAEIEKYEKEGRPKINYNIYNPLYNKSNSGKFYYCSLIIHWLMFFL